MKVRKTIMRLSAAHLVPRHVECICCGARAHHFLPYRKKRAALMCELKCIGTRVDTYRCPRCHAHDRERHLLLYLRQLGLLASFEGKAILHFAPERRLPGHIMSTRPKRYLSCDLHPKQTETQRVDMLDMPFKEDAFDVVIANHVLEHVSDDRQAIHEVFRVLRPGGLAILQTPYSPMLEHTWEDCGIISEAARLQAYGQEDHVRLYGRDIFMRFESTGLHGDIKTHSESLSRFDPDKFGVNPDEPLFLYRKFNRHSCR